MMLTDPAAPNGYAIKKWLVRSLGFSSRNRTSDPRMTAKTRKQLALLSWSAFFLFVTGLASAKSIWDFQEPVTPIARDSMMVSVDFIRIIMAIYVSVFAVFIYSIFKLRKSSGAHRRLLPAQ